MMNIMRKVLSLLIVIGILGGSFIGCGKNNKQMDNKPTNNMSSNINKNKEENSNKISNKNSIDDKKSCDETIGFLRKVAVDNGLIPVEILHLTDEQAKSFGNGNPDLAMNFQGRSALVASLDGDLNDKLGKFYVDTTKDNAKLGQANYLINGKKAWITKIMEASIYLSGYNEGANFAIIGENGKVYNYKDLYDAAKKGELNQLDIKTNKYREVSAGEIAYDYFNPFWVNSTGTLITSKNNPKPSDWQPENTNWQPEKNDNK